MSLTVQVNCNRVPTDVDLAEFAEMFPDLELAEAPRVLPSPNGLIKMEFKFKVPGAGGYRALNE